jgi:hypothetical protein
LRSGGSTLDTVVYDYKDGSEDGDATSNQIDSQSTLALADTFDPALTATNGALLFKDKDPVLATTPVIGSIKYQITNRGSVVTDIRYAVVGASEDVTKLTNQQLLDRSKLLLSTLEKQGVTELPTNATTTPSISLTNGQSLVFFARSGRDTTAAFNRIDLPPQTTGSSSLSLAIEGGVQLAIEASTSVNTLPEFLARDQQLAPVLNFTGLDGVTLNTTVQVAREASLSSSVGFYRILDLNGTVRDPISGVTLTPGDKNYAEVALDPSNLAGLRNFSAGNNQSNQFDNLSITESGYIAPYAQVQGGTTLFAYGAANSDGNSHFKMLGQNLMGLEDLTGNKSDFDYDDLLVAFRFNSSL